MLEEVHQRCSTSFLRANDDEVRKILALVFSPFGKNFQMSFVITGVCPSRRFGLVRVVFEIFVSKLLGGQLNKPQIGHFEQELERVSKSIKRETIPSVILNVCHEDVHFIEEQLREKLAPVDGGFERLWSVGELFVVLSVRVEAAGLTREDLEAYFWDKEKR